MPFKVLSKPLGPVDEDYVEKARAFAAEFVKPNAERWEKNKEQPQDVLRAAIKEFTPLVVPKERGGLGGSSSTIIRVLEEIGKADIGFAHALAVHGNITYGIAQTENTYLRDLYLPKLLSGEMIVAFLLTERESGTDAAAIQTRAEFKDGKWAINGTKSWVTHSTTADLILCFAQTDVGSKGIAGFLFEANLPGVERQEAFDMIGAHAMASGEISLVNCIVEEKNIAFSAGIGFKAAMAAIDFARLGVAAMANGVVEGCLEVGIEYVRERKAFGGSLLSQQGLQWKLADAWTKLEASKLLTYQAAIELEMGANKALACAHAKKFATRSAWEGVHTAMQVMGANGMKREYPIVRQLTGLRVTFFTDGTDEVCNMVIGRSL